MSGLLLTSVVEHHPAVEESVVPEEVFDLALAPGMGPVDTLHDVPGESRNCESLAEQEILSRSSSIATISSYLHCMAFCSLSSAAAFLFSLFFWREAGFMGTTFPCMFSTCKGQG